MVEKDDSGASCQVTGAIYQPTSDGISRQALRAVRPVLAAVIREEDDPAWRDGKSTAFQNAPSP